MVDYFNLAPTKVVLAGLGADGAVEEVSLSGGAVSTVDLLGVPRLWVTPEVGGVVVGALYIDATTGALLAARATVNPGDAVVAAARLSAGYPDAFESFPGFPLVMSVDRDGDDGEITSVYVGVIGIGGTESAGLVTSGVAQHNLAGTLTTVGGVLARDATEAEILAATNGQIAFTFDEADKVRDVVVMLSQPPAMDNGTRLIGLGEHGVLTVRGRSYA